MTCVALSLALDLLSACHQDITEAHSPLATPGQPTYDPLPHFAHRMGSFMAGQ